MSKKKSKKDSSSFIQSQLRTHGIRVVSDTGRDYMVNCIDGHDNATASLSINKRKGYYYCFGCGIKGSWNTLAGLIGAQEITGESGPDPFRLLHEDIKEQLVLTNGQNIKTKNNLPWDLEPWEGPWRRISSYTMDACTAYLWYDDYDPEDRLYRALFPVFVLGELEGWVSRGLTKSTKGRKYRNSPSFGSKRLLFPMDVVSQMKTKSVALVEGPYDALRLVDLDIPALCNFGSGNWKKRKKIHLMNLGIERVVIAGDGDVSGEKMRAKMAADLREEFEVEHFYPPLERDPGNLKSKRLYRELWEMVNLRKWKG
jgi:5S rRNA maturation endonuclease (ribonuclease M5)